MLRALVAYEFSGTVRDAFAARGHDAWSCDLLPTEKPGNHIEGDALEVVRGREWDLLIAHPPCTHLAVSGSRWFKKKRKEQEEALDFFLAFLNAPVPMVCVENPVGVTSSRVCEPSQIVQPWMFGDEATKTTCLWLKNLPHLRPTRVVKRGRRHVTKSGKSLPEWYNLPPSENRWKIRSATFPGLAAAMAEQWGKLPRNHRIGLQFDVKYTKTRGSK